MALAGAAVIASDLPPYQWITDGVAGFLVESEDEWVDSICDLVEVESRRKMMNTALLRRVHQSFSWWSEEARRPWTDFWRRATGV